MKKLLLLITICLAFGCQKNNPQEQLKNINGYWEISEVEASGKLVKKYGFNSAVDFFEIEENEGIRKKLQPQLNGSYIANNSEEKVTAKIENDSLRLYYDTGFDQWKETVLKADETELVLKNQYDKIFYYHKFTGYLDHEKME
ncbi:MAG TPA: lipocalin family protein [Salinimicrobium sp.]|nr:lipocalin family protein [Salinimicrobium sp.]